MLGSSATTSSTPPARTTDTARPVADPHDRLLTRLDRLRREPFRLRVADFLDRVVREQPDRIVFRQVGHLGRRQAEHRGRQPVVEVRHVGLGEERVVAGPLRLARPPDVLGRARAHVAPRHTQTLRVPTEVVRTATKVPRTWGSEIK